MWVGAASQLSGSWASMCLGLMEGPDGHTTPTTITRQLDKPNPGRLRGGFARGAVLREGAEPAWP